MTRQPALPGYGEAKDFPALVWEAVEISRQMEFPLACTPEVGRFLMLLAAHQPRGRICELGTGCGVGAAWLLSGAQMDATLVTIELDAKRAKAAASLLAAHNVKVLTGGWEIAREHGPFDLLFNDGGPKHKPDAPDLILPLLRPGGILVMDDFTPGRASSADMTREIWLDHPSYLAAELNVSPSMAVIMAVRR